MVLDVVRRAEDRGRYEDGCYGDLNIQHTIVHDRGTQLEESMHADKTIRCGFYPTPIMNEGNV